MFGRFSFPGADHVTAKKSRKGAFGSTGLLGSEPEAIAGIFLIRKSLVRVCYG
jgi:hypothetical protein